MRQHGHDNLRFVLEAIDEERTDRTVDQTRGERFLFSRTAFALEVSAWNFAGSVGALLVIDGQREEVDAGLDGAGADDGREYSGFAVLGEDGRVCLTRHVAGFKLQLATTPVNFHAMNIEHVFGLSVLLFLLSTDGCVR